MTVLGQLTADMIHAPFVSSDDIEKKMERRVSRLNNTLQWTASCSKNKNYFDKELCDDKVWQKREEKWRQHVIAWEIERARNHYFRFGNFYLDTKIPNTIVKNMTSSTMRVVLDYFEAEYSCEDESRIPKRIGDGPKWVCGFETTVKSKEDCLTLSLGSNYNDMFEEAIYNKAHCRTYIIDPTLQTGDRLDAFLSKISKYNAQINMSIGIGNSGNFLNGKPLVTISQLIQDYNFYHFNYFKADIEGEEFSMMKDLKHLCHFGQIQIDHLNLEVHRGEHFLIPKFIALFDAAYHCQLMLFHKERNAWGCAGYRCIEFAWISFKQARRVFYSSSSTLFS